MRAHKAPPSRKSHLQSSTHLHANTPHTPTQHPPFAPPSRHILREKGDGAALCCWRANQSAGILVATAAKLSWATMLALLLCSFCLRTLLPWIGSLECGSPWSPEHPWGEGPTRHFSLRFYDCSDSLNLYLFSPEISDFPESPIL